MAYSLKCKMKIMRMKNLISVIGFASLFALSLTAKAQVVESDKPNAESDFQHREVENKAFKDGEFLKYKLAYGFMNAGEAILDVPQSSF